MRIGIDISQIVYEGTGVARYVRELVTALVVQDLKNQYVLFGASLRRRVVFEQFVKTLPKERVTLKTIPIPPTFLDILWNRLHIIQVERFIGNVDVFWSSDWTQPPLTKAKGITTIHDVSPLRFPREHAATIVATHARRLKWVKKECAFILCDSEATKMDVSNFLHIPSSVLRVVYPGFRPLQ